MSSSNSPAEAGADGIPAVDVDRALLAALARDGRASYTDLAERVGLSVSAVHQRVRRLEQRGLITGYRSDCTRTYVVGGPASADVTEWYAVLQAAQEASTASVRPGVTAEDVDAAARRVIDDAGWGEHFIHRTGHGIGLDTHESPYIVAGNSLPLEAGMAFSVEPGIYLAGRCGARIEDIVVCTDDGVRILDNGPRELVELAG